MQKIMSSKPWLLVVLLFGGFVASWVFMIKIAVKHAPTVIPVATKNAQH